MFTYYCVHEELNFEGVVPTILTEEWYLFGTR